MTDDPTLEEPRSAFREAVRHETQCRERVIKAFNAQTAVLSRALDVGRELSLETRTPMQEMAVEVLRREAQTLQTRLRGVMLETEVASREYNFALKEYASVNVSHAASVEQLRLNEQSYLTKIRALGYCVDALTHIRATQDNPGTEDVPEGSYRYISVHLPVFLAQLMALDHMLRLDPLYADAALGYRPVHFLEVGCGTGRNVLIVRESRLVDCASVRGFDINATQIRQGQHTLGMTDALFVADAMTHDYSGVDVVFSYLPFQDKAMQQAHEDRVIDGLPPGGYFVAPDAPDLSRIAGVSPMRQEMDIWRKDG